MAVSPERNPFQSPQTVSDEPEVVGVNSGHVKDLEAVANYQRSVINCLILQIVAIAASFSIPKHADALRLALVPIALISVVCIFAITNRVYGKYPGAILRLMTLLPIIGSIFGAVDPKLLDNFHEAKYLFSPLVGVIALVIVNMKATSVLQRNGIKVGFFGAQTGTILT